MTTLISDTFTASNGTAINGRTPDTTVSGHTWTIGDRFNFAVGTVDIQGNKANINADDDGFTIDCGQNDYDITWIVTTPSSLASAFRGGLIFRSSQNLSFVSGTGTYYFINIRFDLGNYFMVRRVLDVETFLVSSTSFTFNTSTTYTFRITAIGNTIKFYIDGSLIFTQTDSSPILTGSFFGMDAGALGQVYTIDSVRLDSVVYARRTESDRVGSRS